VPPDTSRRMEIAGSPARMLMLGLLGLAMTAGAVPLLVIGWRTGDPLLATVGVAGTLFFGAGSLAIAWRGLSLRGAIVTLTPSGIADRRVARQEIPWRAIESISTWSMHGQRIMVLAVRAEVEASLELTAAARWSRRANRRLGADGLCITPEGLAIAYDDLLAAALAYAEAAHGGPAARTGTAMPE